MPSENGMEVKRRADHVIDVFKTEYDFLSSMCKSVETSFLNLYKTLRDVADPQDFAKAVQVTTETALAGYRRVEDVFDKLEKSQSQESLSDSQEISRSNIIKNNEEFQDRLRVDIAEVASTYDIELKKREQIFRDSFERQKLEAQQRFDSILSQKDAELLVLNEALRSQEHVLSCNSENQMALQNEIEKRISMEEDLRCTKRELEDKLFISNDLRLKLQQLEDDYNNCRLANESLAKEIEMKEEVHCRQIESYRDDVTSLRRTMEAMPSFDLSSLVNKLGMSGWEEEESKKGPGGQYNLPGCPLQWCEIEDWLVTTMRKAQSEASEIRAKEVERKEYIATLETKVDQLRTDLIEKNLSISTLEQDLNSAYSSIEAGKALLRCHKMTDDASATAPNSSALYNISNFSSPSSGTIDLTINNEEGKEARMIKAVLEQRDRMLKQAHAKEEEASILQLQVERLEKDRNSLRLENSELYKRLRVLRVNSSSKPHHSGIFFPSQSNPLGMKKRSTMGEYDEEDIEAKYSQQYVDNIDLFKLEELDRQSMISRMSYCEKGLSHAVRFLMQDKWMRHALLVYLILVHIFALGYVFVVLNPDIERDIDEQWARIYKQEQNYDVMHPDNWA